MWGLLSFKNSLKHLMNCVLGREIVSIKGDLLSLSLSLCLSPRSVPSSFCPLFNTLARKTQEYHARTPQLGFFDFNPQKHSHSSKHKTNNRRKMAWLPQALGKSLCWDRGPVVTAAGLCLLLSSLQMKLAFPSTKSIYIFAHSKSLAPCQMPWSRVFPMLLLVDIKVVSSLYH